MTDVPPPYLHSGLNKDQRQRQRRPYPIAQLQSHNAPGMTAATNMARREHLFTLSQLPDEVLQHILFYLSPSDLLSNVQRISKRFSRLASEPLLWRHHCRVQFKYWDSKHRIKQKFLGNVGDVDWKTLYRHRKRVESETTDILDSIIAGQVNRIQKFKMIADFGYDAKDTLLRHCRTCETAVDVLARREATFPYPLQGLV
jgi:F-box protein 21